MKSDSTTYIIDYVKYADSDIDSASFDDMLVVEEDTSLFFSLDKLSAQNNLSSEAFMNEGHTGVTKVFSLEQDDGVFALLLICFLFFSRIYSGSFSFFRENIRILFSNRDDIRLFSETTITDFWFNFILVFQSVLLSSIILFDIFLESDQYTKPFHSFWTIVLFMVVISLFLGGKYLFYWIIGYLFNVRHKIHIWLRAYLFVTEMMGIIAFIPVLLLVYSQNYHSFLVIFFIVLFVISRLILFYKVITFFLQENINLLFLIAYLCSVEIIPYILLSQILIFLYKIDITNLLWL